MLNAFVNLPKNVAFPVLYLRHIANGDQLKKEFQNWMNEYNFEKPHYGLGIYTPAEVLEGADLLISHRVSFLEAAKKRREINKNTHCTLKCN